MLKFLLALRLLKIHNMKKIVFLIALFTGVFLSAQDKKKEAKEDKKEEKTIASLTKSSRAIEGLFTIYQDTLTGKVKLMIKEDQLNQDFIYFSQIADGVTEAGRLRGDYQGSTVLNITKYFDKIEITAPNTNFYFDASNAIARSKGANTSDAIISSSKILVHDKEKKAYLIDANDLFLSETLTRIKAPRRPKSSPLAFRLGSFDKGKSKIKAINNYPENTNIKTEYVYKNPSVLNGGSNAIQDGRNVSIKVFHAFLEMPDEGYEIRFDDPRVGYFTTQVDDMTSTETTNYRDLVHRWRLIKKNPELAISEPIKPITWWIENTTPVEWREVIKEGVLAWNEAFEQAGFKNAIEVKVQPNDADWDAGDVRYNVLRWTSSPNPIFGGSGPSMVNPRTGEIIGADIMLEYVHFTYRVFYSKLFSSAATNMALASPEELEEEIEDENNHRFCAMGHLMHENMLFGKTLLQTADASAVDLDQLMTEGMKSLIMHEVGHTLGLNHNMKASVIYSPAQLADADFIKGKALTGSVMDYAGINLTLDRDKQGQYYDMAVGPYDVWAIQFGYTPFKDAAAMDNLLARSTEPQLIFGNDADDMRSPGKGIDPRVMTGDLSGDQISYSIDRFKLVNASMRKIKDKMIFDGGTYDDLRRAFYTLNAQAGRAGDVLSRFIGGVYVDRAQAGQAGATKPYTPVSLADQKRAFAAIKTHVFSPNAFQAPNEIYNYLARKRRGFNFRSPEDPKIHDLILGYQTRVLSHLMHPNTLQRIMDAELYGNQYGLSRFMTDLNGAIFDQDIKSNVNTFRQNLQAVYVKRLIAMVSGSSAARFKVPAQSLAIYNLKKIAKMTKSPKGDLASIAHKSHLNTLVNNALKEVK